MSYSTPTYNYGLQTSQLAQNKALTDAYQDYGRFMGQERHRRQLGDMNREFREGFPRVGSSFNQRGLWNSGLRRGGQREAVNHYARALERVNFDQAASESQFERERALSDSGYQQALLSLLEEYQRERTAGYDPFAAIRGQL